MVECDAQTPRITFPVCVTTKNVTLAARKRDVRKSSTETLESCRVFHKCHRLFDSLNHDLNVLTIVEVLRIYPCRHMRVVTVQPDCASCFWASDAHNLEK